jgi:uncharacterized membrane protein
MNRAMFLSELEGYLMDIPKEEREEALAFYTSYFAEAGETGIGKEFEVIKKLGSPRQVADTIKEDMASGGFKEYTEKGVEAPIWQDNQDEIIVPLSELVTVDRTDKKDNSKMILLIILAIFAFPMIMSVFGGIVGITFGGFGLVIGLIGAVIGFAASGIGVLVGGVVLLGVNTATGLLQIGMGLGMIVLGIIGVVLGIKLCIYLVKLIIKIFQSIYSRVFNKKVV